MPSRRGRTSKSTVYKIPEERLTPTFFAVQFSLRDPPKSYNGLKFIIQNGTTHTTKATGHHGFSIELEGTKHFLKLLDSYEQKDKLIVKNIQVFETGLGDRSAKINEIPAVEEEMLRIVINLREDDVNHVGLGISIYPQPDQKITTWIDTSTSFATVISGCMSNLSFLAGNGDIPGKRVANGKSVFVIMDIIPLKDTQYNTADEIAKQSGIRPDKFLDQLKKMHNDGKISTERFQELIKDPENAMRNLMGEGSGAAQSSAPVAAAVEAVETVAIKSDDS